MSKAILVIDMPESCDKCPCFFNAYTDMCCQAINNRGINYPYQKDFRQDWCPLKAMPEKIDIPNFDDNIKAKSENAVDVGMYMYHRGSCSGYNLCIDKILR